MGVVEDINNIPDTTCVHFWNIEEAHGRKSKGLCVKCNAVQSFENSIEYVTKWRDGMDRLAKNVGLEKHEKLNWK